MIRPFQGKGQPPRQLALSEMKLSEPSLWTRPETTRTPDAAIIDLNRMNTPPSTSINPTMGAIVVKQHMPWDGLNGDRIRCWRIQEREAY
jgi:hypothetical protein